MRKILITLSLLWGITNAYSQAELNINDLKICRGGMKHISIEMNNTVEIRAFQAHIVLPKGVKLAGKPSVSSNRIGACIDEFGNKVQSQVVLNYRIKDDGSLVFLVNSTDAIPFKGNEGPIINLSVVADDMAEIGISSIDIKDVELVHVDGCTYTSPIDKICKIEIFDTATSINDLIEFNYGAVDVYSIDGKLLMKNVIVDQLAKSLKKGIYLIEGNKIIIK